MGVRTARIMAEVKFSNVVETSQEKQEESKEEEQKEEAPQEEVEKSEAQSKD